MVLFLLVPLSFLSDTCPALVTSLDFIWRKMLCTCCQMQKNKHCMFTYSSYWILRYSIEKREERNNRINRSLLLSPSISTIIIILLSGFLNALCDVTSKLFLPLTDDSLLTRRNIRAGYSNNTSKEISWYLIKQKCQHLLIPTSKNYWILWNWLIQFNDE